jgi:hypothetical protein
MQIKTVIKFSKIFFMSKAVLSSEWWQASWALMRSTKE